jgi:hypothetical protein
MRTDKHQVWYADMWVRYHWITEEERKVIQCPEDHKWRLDTAFSWYAERYDEEVLCEVGMTSDGATCAMDIESIGWWVHDKLCETGRWLSGKRLCNFEASTVLFDILRAEGHKWRDFWWFLTTFLGGGGEARKNGMFTLDRVKR